MPNAQHASGTCWHTLGLSVHDHLPPALSQRLRGFWELPCGGTGPACEGGAVSLSLQLQLGPVPPVPAAAQQVSTPVMGRVLQVQFWQNQLWIDGLLHADIEQGQVWGDPSASDEAWALLLTECCRAAGWLPLHGAAVAQGERAVVVIGQSGAGKSTATLRLLQAGYRVLAEDRSFWQPSTGRVAGLDRSLRVFADSLERFAPSLAVHKASYARDGKGKYMLPLSSLSGPTDVQTQPQTLPQVGPQTGPQLVRLLVLGGASPDSADAAAAPLSGAACVKQLWEASGWPLTARARQQMQQGMGLLVPFVQRALVSREQVLPLVGECLASPSA